MQREKLNQDLEDLVDRIEELGEKLAATMSLDDLVAYKALIGDFIRLVNQSCTQVSSSLSWGFMGQQRQFTIVREIDKNLADLRDLIMAEESDHLAIVAMVDTIRGLVLDLRL
ncbi:MAG: YaaR family protein [Symbiobacteriaceae bacterium]|nr:YaaR family protein [Symbiobacteriaceae bacterium]